MQSEQHRLGRNNRGRANGRGETAMRLFGLYGRRRWRRLSRRAHLQLGIYRSQRHLQLGEERD